MDTRGIKYHMTNGGIGEKCRMRVSSSHTYNDGKLDGESTVESFTVNAPDGSMFLVQIVKLRKEND